MHPNNIRNTFSDNSNVHASVSNSYQQFRPALSVGGIQFRPNSNVIVTEKQQSNRKNATFNMNGSSSNTINQIEAAKRIIAARQEAQNPAVHLLNRHSQSPIQINQNSPILIDRPQIMRLPEGSQTDTSVMNDIYQALHLIQQNLQTTKNKSSQKHIPEVCRPIISTIQNQPMLNSLANITINSTSHNHNATVLTMCNTQLLEAIGRLNSQQSSKPTGHTNVSLIQSNSIIAQQLLNSFNNQSLITSPGIESPSFMVIGQTSKPNNLHVNQTKGTINSLPTPLHSNKEFSNSLILKMPINSKAGIPVWTKLLDKLSNNPENLTELNRSSKIQDSDDNNKNTQTQSREFIQRSSETSNPKPIPTMLNPSNNIDNHQILRESKKISYLMSNSNNMTINNDDMVNLHFQESLKDKLDNKKSINQIQTSNYKSFESNNGISSHDSLYNTKNIRNQSYCSLIDLEQPEYGITNIRDGTSHISSPNQNLNTHLIIKEKTDLIIENLLKQSLNNDYNQSIAKHSHLTNDGNRIGAITNSNVCQSSITTHIDNVLINPRDNLINNTSMSQASHAKGLNFVNSRPNLPLKKRIMLDFDENGDVKIPSKVYISTKQECNVEMNIPNTEKQIKIRCKRNYAGLLNNDRKIESTTNGPSLPLPRKRRGRIPGSGKNQKLKAECRLKEMAKINLAGTEESWQELMTTIIKPPDIESISTKTLSAFDFDSLKCSKKEFFQIGSCTEIAPKMVKCRSCRKNNTQNNVNNNESSTNAMDDASSIKSGSKDSNAATDVSSFCRFHGFRKLQFNAKGTLAQAGFCKSNDADPQDMSLWRMYHPLPSELSVSIATYLVQLLSPIFCEIIDAENTILQQSYLSTDDSDSESFASKIIPNHTYSTGPKSNYDGFYWKRPVQGVREMCDVCDSSIFNTHWACRKCGYLICVDCFNERSEFLTSLSLSQDSKEKYNDYQEIIPFKNSVHLNTRGARKHRYSSCNHPWAVCTANQQPHNPDQLLKVELIPANVICELRNRMHTVGQLLQIKLKCNCLTKSKLDSQSSHESVAIIEKDKMNNIDIHMLADIALDETVSTESDVDNNGTCGLGYYHTGVPRPTTALHTVNDCYQNGNNQQWTLSDKNMPVFSLINVSSNLKMLHLHHAQSSHNLKLFQKRWLYGHPILVSGCHDTMDVSMWTPEKFLEEFELEQALLVDCDTGLTIPKNIMKSFWEGFSNVNKRISSSESCLRVASLKLKDWPPSENSNDVLPQRCKDILSHLPIKEYTGRQGAFNLAAHLPDFFVRPDLGPRLYNAYGMPRESQLGTTNLQLAITDTVNVMLYVEVPNDHADIEIQDTLYIMKEALVDGNVIKRAELEIPGALRHIFLPKDVPKLRQFLNDVLIERGETVGVNQDAIHDQQFYLNQPLLDRLKETYDIEGCAIVQFRGDAVFIPAGSAHQVINLHSCMEVACDFVSPENILNSLMVTKEFRKLSPTHSNKEGKLQAKSMIFHTVKDAVSTLIMSKSKSIPDPNGLQKDYQTKRKRYN